MPRQHLGVPPVIGVPAPAALLVHHLHYCEQLVLFTASRAGGALVALAEHVAVQHGHAHDRLRHKAVLLVGLGVEAGVVVGIVHDDKLFLGRARADERFADGDADLLGGLGGTDRESGGWCEG